MPVCVCSSVDVASLSDLVAPQALGTPVTWTASAAGGQAPYTYRFIVWDGVAWTDARAWGASNVFTWTPPVANPDYKVAVLVRSAWNTGANDMLEGLMRAALVP